MITIKRQPTGDEILTLRVSANACFLLGYCKYCEVQQRPIVLEDFANLLGLDLAALDASKQELLDAGIIEEAG